jgi:8-oxo-dGTP pyrophosphatase MutT (NUDIX family)
VRQHSGCRRRSPARRALLDPGPPAAWSWLSTDWPALARREFVFQVLFAELDADELVDCCELFRLRWGAAALIAALRFGHRQAPLPDAARQLLVAYTVEAAA